MKVLITNAVPEDHLVPLHGVAQVIHGPKEKATGFARRGDGRYSVGSITATS